MTADEILAQKEDDREYHFHLSDRLFVLEAMEEYAQQEVEAFAEWIRETQSVYGGKYYIEKGLSILSGKHKTASETYQLFKEQEGKK